MDVLQIVQEKGPRTVLDYQDGKWVDLDPIRCGLDVPLSHGGTIIAYPYLSSDPLFGSLCHVTLPECHRWRCYLVHSHPRFMTCSGSFLCVCSREISKPRLALALFIDTAESDPQRYLTLPDDFVPISKTWARRCGAQEGTRGTF